MKSVYWVLAGGLVAAIAAAIWFARPLGQETVATRSGAAPATEVAQTSNLSPQQDVFEDPEIDAEMPPSFDIVRMSRNGSGVIAGRARPGDQVSLRLGEEVIASARSDENGEWVIILSEPISPGSVELSLSVTGADGQPVVSENVVVLEIPNDEATGVLAVLSPEDGEGASRALQMPTDASPTSLSLHIGALDILPDGSAIVSGRADPGDRLRIYLNNAYINEVNATEDGVWSLNVGALGNEEENELRVDEIAADEGDIALRIVQPFRKNEPGQLSQGTRSVVVTRGNNLWAIARAIYGGGELFSLIFEENAGQIRNPDLIYPGQVFDLPESAAGP